MIAKLNFLAEYLQKFNYHEYDEIVKLIKLSSILGVDYPAEEVDKEGISEVLKYLDENPGKFIFLDNPEGTEKRFGKKNYRKMPFHYGEFIEINNPADDMGWDIVIVPSSSDAAESCVLLAFTSPINESILAIIWLNTVAVCANSSSPFMKIF